MRRATLTGDDPVTASAHPRHVCERWELPPDASAVAKARQLVAAALHPLGLAEDVAGNAVLAVSELVANAVTHASAPYALCLCADGRVGVMCEVLDGGVEPVHFPPLGLPLAGLCGKTITDPDAEDGLDDLDEFIRDLAEDGRGLSIVAQLCDGNCGSHRLGHLDGDGRVGKAVWFVLNTH